MSDVFKALADPTRRRILQLLHDRPMTAGELADEFDFSKATMSGHFNVLKGAGLIYGEKHGTSITYRLKLSVLEDTLLGFAELFDSREAAGSRKHRDPGAAGQEA